MVVSRCCAHPCQTKLSPMSVSVSCWTTHRGAACGLRGYGNVHPIYSRVDDSDSAIHVHGSSNIWLWSDNICPASARVSALEFEARAPGVGTIRSRSPVALASQHQRLSFHARYSRWLSSTARYTAFQSKHLRTGCGSTGWMFDGYWYGSRFVSPRHRIISRM